jgi:hypothetical protein
MFESVIFVELSSTKECTRQPPPKKNGNECKHLREHARNITFITILQ